METDSMEIRVAIFEDDRIVREDMQMLLDAAPGFTCTGAFMHGRHWEDDIRRSSPDVVLIDIEMAGINGIEITRKMREVFSEIKIMIHTVLNENEKIFNALCAGVSGYILKSDPVSKCLESINEVYNGGAAVSPPVAKKIIDFFRNKNVILVSPCNGHCPLSIREKELVQLMSEGLSLKEIAERSFISYETVRTHIKNIYKKMHVSSRSEAILKAMQQGFTQHA